jgi:hypothetical protein
MSKFSRRYGEENLSDSANSANSKPVAGGVGTKPKVATPQVVAKIEQYKRVTVFPSTFKTFD